MSGRGMVEVGWRVLCAVSAVVAVWGLLLRRQLVEGPEFVEAREGGGLRREWRACVVIACAAGFGHVTFSLAFTLMNGFVPLVTELSRTEAMHINTALLAVDMCALPLFGWLASRIGRMQVMGGGAVAAVVLALPMFAMLEGACFMTVVGVRLAIALAGVAFAAPYHAWAVECVAPRDRYTGLSLGSAIGALLIGAPSCAVALWLYRLTGWRAGVLLNGGGGAGWGDGL